MRSSLRVGDPHFTPEAFHAGRNLHGTGVLAWMRWVRSLSPRFGRTLGCCLSMATRSSRSVSAPSSSTAVLASEKWWRPTRGRMAGIVQTCPTVHRMIMMSELYSSHVHPRKTLPLLSLQLFLSSSGSGNPKFWAVGSRLYGPRSL